MGDGSGKRAQRRNFGYHIGTKKPPHLKLVYSETMEVSAPPSETARPNRSWLEKFFAMFRRWR